MPVVRDYRCNACSHLWQVFHANSSDPVPDCPHCAGRADWQPGGFNMKSNVSKAGDLAQQMLVDDFGLNASEINDQQREGDIAYKPPAKSREVKDAEAQIADVTRAVMNEYQKAGSPPPLPTHPAWGGQTQIAQTAKRAEIIAGARNATQTANREGVNPMLLLQKAQKSGMAPTKARVLTDHGERAVPIGKNLFGGG